jgi:hypothetical protein
VAPAAAAVSAAFAVVCCNVLSAQQQDEADDDSSDEKWLEQHGDADADKESNGKPLVRHAFALRGVCRSL